MDLDRTLITIHILCAVIWVGGAAVTQLFAMRAQAAGPHRLAEIAGDIEWIGTRVFIPTSLVLLTCGIWLVSRDIFTLQGWVVFGIVAFAISFVTGAAFLGPESGRIQGLIATQGPDSPETIARIKRIFLVSRIELVLLILVVLDMAWKPGT
jgi:uncharacterized membrane protein